MNQKQLIKYLYQVSYPYRKKGIMSNPLKYLKKHIKDIPNCKLYQYRKCSSIHIDTLRKQSVWLSSADKFDDIFDTLLNFKTDELMSDKEVISVYKAKCLSSYIDSYYSVHHHDTYVDNLVDLSPKDVHYILTKAYDANFIFSPQKAERYLKKKTPKWFWERKKKILYSLIKVFSEHGNNQELVNYCRTENDIAISFSKEITKMKILLLH